MIFSVSKVTTLATILVVLVRGEAAVLSWTINRIFSYVANSSLLNCDFTKTENLDVSLLRLYRYDYGANTTIGYSLDIAAKTLLNESSFNRTYNMVFFIPGFGNTLESDGPVNIINGYRGISNSYIFILDASKYTSNRGGLYEISSYEKSVRYTPYIGRQFSKFLQQLNKASCVSLKNIHVIGHSLGAQCAGYVGQHFRSSTGRKLKRLTGLDPAGPCYNNADIDNILDWTDAEFVDIYHCNVGVYGTSQIRGTVDFFPNGGGYIQPKCEVHTPNIIALYESASCSHDVCPAYWSESVADQDAFIGRQCGSWYDFKNGICSNNLIVIAGYGTPSNVTQKFYYITQNNSPYGLGLEGTSR